MGDRTDDGESESAGFFASYHDVRVGGAELRQVPELRERNPESWAVLPAEGRLAVLQEAEGRLARVQGRPAYAVEGENLGEGAYGYFDGRCIVVNTHSSVFDDRAECVNTIAHEGRHAYQSHAVRNEGFHPEHPLPERDENRAWRSNLESYKTIEEHGAAAYLQQPVEHDAGAFGFALAKQVYPDYHPQPNRIDQYNAATAERQYGVLAPESQPYDLSLPAHARDRRGAEVPEMPVGWRAGSPLSQEARGARRRGMRS